MNNQENIEQLEKRVAELKERYATFEAEMESLRSEEARILQELKSYYDERKMAEVRNSLDS